MGAIADAIVRFAQPLIDETDGSPERVQTALSVAQLCWNLAITPADERDALLASMQPALKMDADAFEIFKHDIVTPMIRRHEQMFPDMQGKAGPDSSPFNLREVEPQPATRASVKKYPGTGRNERCPCGSGKKYKLCCGR